MKGKKNQQKQTTNKKKKKKKKKHEEAAKGETSDRNTKGEETAPDRQNDHN